MIELPLARRLAAGRLACVEHRSEGDDAGTAQERRLAVSEARHRRVLRVHPAHLRDRRDAVDGDDVGGGAHVDLVLAATSAARRRTPRTSSLRGARSLPSRSRSSRGDPAPTRSTTSVTPPALARMSGTTKTPRSCRCRCASGVVGPLAPSTTIFALMAGALSIVIWFSSAAGMRTSTSSANSSSLSSGSPPGKPSTVLCCCAWSSSVGDVEARWRCRRRPSSR